MVILGVAPLPQSDQAADVIPSPPMGETEGKFRREMRSVKAKVIWGVALMLVLVLGSAGAVPARSLDSREEAALFSLGDLGPVDLSPKTVTVELYVGPEAE